jgi:hypothetical protein
MYRWIWQRFPFGVPGRIAGMLMLVTGVAMLLWYVVFPKLDPLLPFDDVRVTSPAGGVPSAPATAPTRPVPTGRTRTVPAPTGLPK